jgi:hypothetical protein
MALTKQQKELVVEEITGFGGFEAAMAYLLKLNAAKKRTKKLEKELWEFLSEVRVALEEISQD